MSEGKVISSTVCKVETLIVPSFSYSYIPIPVSDGFITHIEFIGNKADNSKANIAWQGNPLYSFNETSLGGDCFVSGKLSSYIVTEGFEGQIKLMYSDVVYEGSKFKTSHGYIHYNQQGQCINLTQD